MAEEKKIENPVRLRFRRSASLGGKTVQAGAVESFEPSDEVWEAVNRGDADLDPPPGTKIGEGVQPTPPEWVSGESPEGEDAKPKKGAKPVKAAAADAAKLTDADGGDADDLDGMTAAELHDVARDEEVEGHSGLNKADLLAAIRKGRKSKK
jgi:hypothetical protein